MNPQQLAEAFSAHRFQATYDQLADDVRWVLPGQATIEGKPAVLAACADSLAEFAALAETSFDRFVSVGGPNVAAVDAIGRYVSTDGSTSVVSSADIYDFDARGRVVQITSYAVELDN
jgi:ketosteroid isomerase-like protein